jgi:predicted dehydrogenase
MDAEREKLSRAPAPPRPSAEVKTPSSTAAVKAGVRVGVIGAGAIAQVALLPILHKLRGVCLTAICDNDGAKARMLAQRFGVSDYFTDEEDLLSAGLVDAVIVATPNHMHEPHTLSALHAGVDVMCRQPLALTAAGVGKILDAASKAGRKIVASYPMRFRSDAQALAGFLRGRELGALFGVRAQEYHQRGSAVGWRLRRAEAGGGAFIEYGFVLVDLALWLADFPAPQRVSAQFVRGSGRSSVEETMVVLLSCAGGFTCTFDVTWSYVGDHDRSEFELLAEDGSARLGPLRVVKYLGGRPRDVTPTGASTRESLLMQGHRGELAHFVAVLHGDAPYEPPEDQRIVLRVIEAAYRSAEEGRDIIL